MDGEITRTGSTLILKGLSFINLKLMSRSIYIMTVSSSCYVEFSKLIFNNMWVAQAINLFLYILQHHITIPTQHNTTIPITYYRHHHITKTGKHQELAQGITPSIQLQITQFFSLNSLTLQSLQLSWRNQGLKLTVSMRKFAQTTSASKTEQQQQLQPQQQLTPKGTPTRLIFLWTLLILNQKLNMSTLYKKC